jgi:hypothetical protein
VSGHSVASGEPEDQLRVTVLDLTGAELLAHVLADHVERVATGRQHEQPAQQPPGVAGLEVNRLIERADLIASELTCVPFAEERVTFLDLSPHLVLQARTDDARELLDGLGHLYFSRWWVSPRVADANTSRHDIR